jgi:hypothetical protein
MTDHPTTDAALISDRGREPVVACRRKDGVLIRAGKAWICLSHDEIGRLISFAHGNQPVSVTPAKARMA